MKKLRILTIACALVIAPTVAEKPVPQKASETNKIVRAVGQFLRTTAGLGLSGFIMDMGLSLWLAYQVPNPNLVTLWPAIFGRANNHNCTKGTLLFGALLGAKYAAEILEERKTGPLYIDPIDEREETR